MDDTRTPCPSCNLFYGHRTDCRVTDLHRALDRAIAQYGLSSVEVAYRIGGSDSLAVVPTHLGMAQEKKTPDSDLCSLEDVLARREVLSQEFMALDNAFSGRGLEIADELSFLDKQASLLRQQQEFSAPVDKRLSNTRRHPIPAEQKGL